MFERDFARQMLANFFCAAFLLSGCAGKENLTPADVSEEAFNDLRAAVADAVDGPAREAAAIRLVDQLELDVTALRDRLAERQRKVYALNSDYDTPREDFEAYLAQVATELQTDRKRATETQLALSRTITPEEAREVVKARSKAMQSVIASFQSI